MAESLLGPHAAYIIPCYIVSALVIIVMILRITSQYKTQQREIVRLEETGVKRRSAK